MPNISKIIQRFTSGTYSSELKQSVWKWLIAPSKQEEKEKVLMDVWKDCKATPNEDIHHSYQIFKQRTQQKERKLHIPTKIWARIAATILIPVISVGLTYLYWDHQFSQLEFVQCSVPIGKQHIVQLSDGTKIKLNAGSVLIYPNRFIGKDRSVYLTGEGYFDVISDKKHPFIVKTQFVNVQVLGTQFNISAYPDQKKTMTSLETGSIAMYTAIGDKPIALLTPNEQLEYDNSSGKFFKKKNKSSLYSAWTKGELNFIAQPLNDIIKTLERHYAITIQVSPFVSATDLYTIKFKRSVNAKEVLHIIAQTIGNVNLEQVNDHIFRIVPSN